MTEQEVFDKVVAYLRQQNYVPAETQGTCVYRGDNGRMCAVGCLIPDELYSGDLERTSSDDVCAVLGPKGWAPAEHKELLSDLQWMHDTYMKGPASRSTVERYLENTAADYRLVYTPALE